MASKVQICNIALSHVGGRRIQSLTEQTKEARECSNLYDIAREATLRDHDWAFARKRQVLALLAETYTGWAYAYQYPSDCLTAIKILDETGQFTGTSYDLDEQDYKQTGKVEYEIGANSALNARVIMTNKSEAELVYTANVEDVNMFDANFIKALALYLASDLSVPIRGKPELQQGFLNQYLLFIEKAKATSSTEDYKKPNNVNTLLRSRL